MTTEEKRRNIELACLLEATAHKAGNVHPGRDFADFTYLQLMQSAVAIGPILAQITEQHFGKVVLECIRITRQVANTNTNLGIVLLLAPLCAVEGALTPEAVGEVLSNLTVEDARLVYEAIRVANPGGLGKANEQDVNEGVDVPLVDAMSLAQDRDTIARQYSQQFRDVLHLGVDAIVEAQDSGAPLEEAILWCQLRWLESFPDSLIARKRGAEEAGLAMSRAKEIVDAMTSRTDAITPSDEPLYRELDTWLRAPGQSRNPGTTADLVAASLFSALKLEKIDLNRAYSLTGQ